MFCYIIFFAYSFVSAIYWRFGVNFWRNYIKNLQVRIRKTKQKLFFRNNNFCCSCRLRRIERLAIDAFGSTHCFDSERQQRIDLELWFITNFALCAKMQPKWMTFVLLSFVFLKIALNDIESLTGFLKKEFLLYWLLEFF